MPHSKNTTKYTIEQVEDKELKETTDVQKGLQKHQTLIQNKEMTMFNMFTETENKKQKLKIDDTFFKPSRNQK